MITKSEYAKRRSDLMELMADNSIAIVAAAKQKVRSKDTFYPFRQDSDFYYLTGIIEPDAILLLIPKRKHGEYVLFCREKDPLSEVQILGPEKVKKIHACDDTFPLEDIEDILPGLMEDKEHIYYDFGHDIEFDSQVLAWNRSANKSRKHPSNLISLNHFLHDMRMIKTASEIQLIKKAAQISSKAHIAAMQLCEPDITELRIESEIKYHFANHGAKFEAYPTIVAGAERACLFHYTDNKHRLKDGDLLLIDAGAEYQGYASDISRTIPVNGRFSEEQKEVYQWVLKANIAAIKAAKPGNLWSDPHDEAIKVLTQGLIEMGILQGELEQLIFEEAYKPYNPYKTGHWLGLDVHDVGNYTEYDEPAEFYEGMVLTIEPGLYLSPTIPGLDKKWKGIGVRIEDLVVITKKGNTVLSKSVPKTVQGIESLMSA